MKYYKVNIANKSAITKLWLRPEPLFYIGEQGRMVKITEVSQIDENDEFFSEGDPVRCNECLWYGDAGEVSVDLEIGEEVCPQCSAPHALMDLTDRHKNILKINLGK